MHPDPVPLGLLVLATGAWAVIGTAVGLSGAIMLHKLIRKVLP